MWRCLDEVANREGLSVNQLCTLIDARRSDAALTASLRVFLVGYLRAVAATAPGPQDREGGGLADGGQEPLGIGLAALD